ncbi:hypothetical protein D3C80_2093900 [compost metagenome]
MLTKNESIPTLSSNIPPAIPPAATARLKTVTSIDCAISTLSPAVSAMAVCNSVGAPPNVTPHKTIPIITIQV